MEANRIMTPAELGWVAGLLEGEGCFFPIKYQTQDYGPYTYARIAVLMTDLDVLERLQQLTGVGRISGPTIRKNPNHKPLWHWVVSKNKESITLMKELYPLMGERRRARIDEVLALAEKGRG
jgi:LAGLIDADG DNA endonuclease family protein